MKINPLMNQNPQKLNTEMATERFPIRILSEKTNIGTSTLRAWERRYGLLHPARTPKGHRLYNVQDVQHVLKIVDLLNDGHSLPAIAEMLSVNQTGSENDEAISNVAPSFEMSSIWQDFMQSTLDAVSDFNIERIDAIYNEASSLYPLDMVTDRLIQPTLTRLGEAWKQHPERGIAEEHFYSSWLKNRLGARFHHAYTNARGARIVCACAPGSYHETGLMLFSLSALARGYRVLYFGADMPLNQLHYITRRSAAKAVVLSVYDQMSPAQNTQLTQLVRDLPTPLFIGGAGQLDDSAAFETAGGILLGASISVALRVFENHIPVYPEKRETPRSK
ncbi:MAG: MerR family transcriptional regulator [Gammaproteobacteria bacterium]|nr:MerR family transcriptional regulator [Gammaproteobacteria bacterium]